MTKEIYKFTLCFSIVFTIASMAMVYGGDAKAGIGIGLALLLMSYYVMFVSPKNKEQELESIGGP